jgi:hypothetical protein
MELGKYRLCRSLNNRSRFLNFFDFQFLTTEFELAKEFKANGKSIKCVFLYFHVFLCGNESLGLKKNH